MKILLLRRALALLLGCTLFISAFAQPETHTEFITRANFIFANLEKNRVPNGLLLDYAIHQYMIAFAMFQGKRR